MFFRNFKFVGVLGVASSFAMTSTAAFAADDVKKGDDKKGVESLEMNPRMAPPEPPKLNDQAKGITVQAGVGSEASYARAGVVELGGSAGLVASTDLTTFNISPSIGWFFTDNFQLSGIISTNYSHIKGKNGAPSASTGYVAVLAEPSVHIPFTPSFFGFAGVGLGVSVAGAPGKTATAGFALSPRLGVNVLIGRSGILSPFVAFDYSTNGVIQTPTANYATISAGFRANIGYTVMW